MKIHELNNQMINAVEQVSGVREWDSTELNALCQKVLSPIFNSV